MVAIKLNPIAGIGCFNCGRLINTPITFDDNGCGCSKYVAPRPVVLCSDGRVYENLTLNIEHGYVESYGTDLGSWWKVFGISHE